MTISGRSTPIHMYMCSASVTPYDGPFIAPSHRVVRDWPGMTPEYPPVPIPFSWGPHGSLILLGLMMSPVLLAVVVLLLLGAL